MSPAAPIEQEPGSSKFSGEVSQRRRFANLRGVQWRIDLGILPSPSPNSPSSSSAVAAATAAAIDDLRRVSADSRRRYASLRRRLLVDPHLPKDGISSPPDLVMDNPLSQNPDSTWGRFFRNAELEKTVDQDLSRLYPEHGSYFQTPGCQGMLRRILLLWCLRHPEYGYRQGMHELLAPLLYVLHVDVEHLADVRKQYEDHFTDKFDGLSVHENDLTYNFDFKKFLDSMEGEIGTQGKAIKVTSPDELDPEVQTIVLLSDAYGAEGELGVVLSEKFMEHDAYSMFDALMSGARGAVAMADFFTPLPAAGSHSGLPPVIEASAALYHLLSIVDSSLHSHFVELGVEPQYFALRWFRVLFGREFSLEDLLLIWDEIFAANNDNIENSIEDDESCCFGILFSPRGALISAMAVSMMLYLRSSLLATENATTCLQRLLNFPENINLRKIIDKAKSLQALAVEAGSSLSSASGAYKPMVVSGHTLSFDLTSPKTPLSVVPDSYWEEKWRVLHNAEERKLGSLGKQSSTPQNRWSEKVKLSVSRTESDPSPAKVGSCKKDQTSSVRRSLLEDLSHELGLDKDLEKEGCGEILGQDDLSKDFSCTSDNRCPSGQGGSEENSSVFSDPCSPLGGVNNHEIDSEKSSVASNLNADENYDHHEASEEEYSLPVSHPCGDVSWNSQSNNESEKSLTVHKDQKLHSGRFQWFWKLGRNISGKETSEKGSGVLEATKSVTCASNQRDISSSSSANGSCNSYVTGEGDGVDQNVMVSLRNLGQSMLEHIQVIESVFQQDHGQVGSLENLSKNVLVGKGQVTAMTALKELRKISNLLSEM